MSKIEALVQMLAFADGDEKRTEEIVKVIEELQGKQAAAFYRNNPKVAQRMEQDRINAMKMMEKGRGGFIINRN